MRPLEALFRPFRIKTLELKKRIVMPPMATNFAGPDGFINDKHIAYYVRRIQGGVGYITSEHTGILMQGRAFPNMTLIHSDRCIYPFRRLVNAVHAEGGKIVIQVNHAGRQTTSSVTGSPLVAPSALPCPIRKEMPRELSWEEIQSIVEAFGEASRRVREAGADGVEIHMAHGYLISQFLSPFSNRRTDSYGGDRKGRTRFALEVLTAVRNKAGLDFPVICRISADEFVEGGLRINDTKEIAKALEKAGADAIHVSAGVGASAYFAHPSYYMEEGTFVPFAKEIKSVVSIPVIVVGRIRTPELANQILEEGTADLISMGRALIADPHMPEKALEGRREDILPCISCNRCAQSVYEGDLHCAVNPETGNEEAFKFQKTDHPKKVWVIGGGPAGMKAAEISARRGHDVTLYEEKGELGGRFLLAAIPPRKEILKEFIRYLQQQLEKLSVKIVLGKLFTPGLLNGQEPDVLIVATGANPFFPPLEGLQQSNAISVDEALSSDAALPGRKILIIGGGGIGAEAADHLSEKRRDVTLIEMREEIALDVPSHLRYFLNKRLRAKGVQILTSTKAVRFEKNRLWVEGFQGTRRLGDFDTTVIAMGSIPDNKLLNLLEGKAPNIYVVGDASKSKEVLEAVYTAEENAIKI